MLMVVPDQGPTTGFTDVTITGTNFFGSPTVTFGGLTATDVLVVNTTTITAKTPSHVSGLVDVSVTTSNGTGTLTDGFRYTCAAGAAEQCVEASITGTITFEVPDDITFPAMESSNMPQDSFSYDAAGYTHDINDLLTVYDSRNSGGFQVQVQASTPFETSGGTFHIPIDHFYMATTSSETGGFRFDPPSDDGIEYDSSPVLPCVGSSLDVTPSPRSLIPAVLTTPSTFTQALGYEPDTYFTLNLMNCDLSPSQGRTGTFRQEVNYYLNVPGGQPGGTYNITLTYDLVT